MKIEKITSLFLVLMICLICSACDGEGPTSNMIIGLDVEVVGVPVIFETDMTLDVDDVGALAVLHGLQTEGKVTILGVSYNEVHPLAPDAIDAINTYYHRGT
ncbi:MAG TPA: nucleoside hydrolase, partial [Candidatus Marinimicrobia bacterium]|nr:nucleoside hydrolase [Candidatus Neomarinimicrobiota bacterium]